MKIPSLFRRRRSFSRRNTPARRNSGENGSPKTGWLALAVVGVFVLMLFLVVVNVKLLFSPAASGKRSVPSDHARSEFDYPAGANAASTTPDRICAPSPAITFDSKRNSSGELKSEGEDESADPPREEEREKACPQAQSASPTKDTGAQSAKSVVKKEISSERDKARHKKTLQTYAKSGPEKPEVSAKRYTVQVGAFTKPQMAQHEARAWKSRGYDAVLRPVAMPKSGVIYRLYLGSFNSAKEADDLVKELKTKGFTSFKLPIGDLAEKTPK